MDTSKRKWRQISGFPDYEVSEDGLVRSWRKKARVWRKPDVVLGRRETPILLKGTKAYCGYTAFILRDSTERICRKLLHRLVAEAFIPNTANHGIEVCHNDGNPSNNHYTNLRWDTHQNNQLDMRKHGTMQDGQKSRTAKLSAEEVALIRASIAKQERTQKCLAEKFNVSTAQISRIVNNKAWKN